MHLRLNQGHDVNPTDVIADHGRGRSPAALRNYVRSVVPRALAKCIVTDISRVHGSVFKEMCGIRGAVIVARAELKASRSPDLLLFLL